VPPFRREKISCLRPQLLPSRGAGQRESPGRKRSAAGERTGRETGGAGEQADSLERRRLTAAALAKEGAEEVHTARWQLRGRGEGRGQPARTRDGARKVPSSQRRPAPRRSPPAVSSRSERLSRSVVPLLAPKLKVVRGQPRSRGSDGAPCMADRGAAYPWPCAILLLLSSARHGSHLRGTSLAVLPWGAAARLSATTAPLPGCGGTPWSRAQMVVADTVDRKRSSTTKAKEWDRVQQYNAFWRGKSPFA
jgi:hypothetical protein